MRNGCYSGLLGRRTGFDTALGAVTLGSVIAERRALGSTRHFLLEEDVLSRAQKLNQNNLEMRKTIEKDLQAFLASGKKIQVIPMGVSGQDKMGRSKNIVISRKRRTAIRAT